jgi:hypothetical protein
MAAPFGANDNLPESPEKSKQQLIAHVFVDPESLFSREGSMIQSSPWFRGFSISAFSVSVFQLSGFVACPSA